MRKPWMNHLKSFRFNREGTLTQETAAEHKAANTLASTAAGLFADYHYACIMGITLEEALGRIKRQKETLERHNG